MTLHASDTGSLDLKQSNIFGRAMIAIWLLASAGAYAQDQNPAQSVLQQKPTKDYSHLTTVPDNQKKSLADRCSEMLQEAEALKGKPQRRATAMARYRAECERP